MRLQKKSFGTRNLLFEPVGAGLIPAREKIGQQFVIHAINRINNRRAGMKPAPTG